MDTNKLLLNLERYTDLIWGEFAEIYPQIVRLNPPKIFLNNRFRSQAGCCAVEHNEIELATKFFIKPANRATMLRVVLPHEIAHQIDYNLNGFPPAFHWHGPSWSEIMQNYGLQPLACHSMKL